MSRVSLVKDITSNVCGSLLDLVLWNIALVGASVGKTGPTGVHRAFREADDFLKHLNHKTLATTWYQLTRKKLITYKKRAGIYSAEITELGKKKLTETFPEFQKKRPWDKKIYLITYDIPQKANYKRDILRNFLKRIEARLLQESTWITIYNPRKLIVDFVKKINIPGTIIVSDIGRDGGIGEENLTDFLTRVYSLENLNERYDKFIKKTKSNKHAARDLIFEYLSILKEDPQLPFELLPKGWLGNNAYLNYQKLSSKYILNYQQLRRN